MIRKLQKIYALSEQGAKDLVKATAWTVAANLSLMVPMSILMLALMKIIDALTEGSDPAAGAWKIVGAGVVLLVLIYWIHFFRTEGFIRSDIDNNVRQQFLRADVRKLSAPAFRNDDIHSSYCRLPVDHGLADGTGGLMGNSSGSDFADRFPEASGLFRR